MDYGDSEIEVKKICLTMFQDLKYIVKSMENELHIYEKCTKYFI